MAAQQDASSVSADQALRAPDSATPDGGTFAAGFAQADRTADDRADIDTDYPEADTHHDHADASGGSTGACARGRLRTRAQRVWVPR